MSTIESLSVVIPVFNDQEVLRELHPRLLRVLAELDSARVIGGHEVIFVDDGSSDASLAVLLEIQTGDSRTVVIQLSRNFGQPGALAAGLQESRGDVVVLMDSDLQDRPEDIPVLLAALQKSGYPMAIARRLPSDDTGIERCFIRMLFRITTLLTGIAHDHRLGVFRALDRSAVELVRDLPASAGTQLSYLYWLKTSYAIVDLQRDMRFAGSSSYTFKRKVNLIAERIFAFSTLPFRRLAGLGAGLGLSCLVLAVILAKSTALFSGAASGWDRVFVTLVFLLGVGCFGIVVISEHMRRHQRKIAAHPRYRTERIYRSQSNVEE